MTTPNDRELSPGAEENSVRCSFCDKGEETVGLLIESPTWPGREPAYICAECAELCAEVIERRKQLRDTEQERDKSPIDAATQGMLEEKIDQVLSILTSPEREVLKLRYGLCDGSAYTLEEVARRFEITRERVQEIESNAIKILQSRESQP